jgi:nucleotide-binding universal stress UspA family protein
MAGIKIVVPLDGSELAESALNEALTLGKALDAEVILLQVIPVADDVIRQGATVISIDEQWQTHKERALLYLNGVRNRPEWRRLNVRVVVEMGNPAETILDYCRDHGIDRIVMATHGRTGMSRWVFGSVAEKVLRAADRTVVLVRAGTEKRPS